VRAKEMSTSFKALRREKICRALVAGTLSEEFLFDDEADLSRHWKAAVEPAPDGAKKDISQIAPRCSIVRRGRFKNLWPYKTEDVVLFTGTKRRSPHKKGDCDGDTKEGLT